MLHSAGHGSVSRIANQLLLAPPVHSGNRHRSRAWISISAAHHYFDHALAAVGVAATRQRVGPSLAL